MFSRKIGTLLLLILSSAIIAVAQNPTSPTATEQQTPNPAKQQEEKERLEKKAVALLEQVVTDSQGLRLPENKIRVQIAAGDMLWEKSPARARGLLSDAGAMLAQVLMEVDRTDRGDMQTANQLRQDLVLTAGRHDAELGYQLLRTTQPPPPSNNASGTRRVLFEGNNLEQSLLATVAATDPKFAYQKAVESLDKGEFPTALNRVLSQLQTKDPEAFQKLSDKTLSRLASESLLASREATSVAVNLLMPGPVANSTNDQPAAAPGANTRPGMSAVLNETAYRGLMENVITAALSTTSAAPAVNNPRGGGGAARVLRGPQQAPQNPQDPTQVRQNNARTLLFSLQPMMPQIEQYLPERATAVRQKLTDLGVNNNAMMNFGNQMRAAMQQGTSDSLETAAKTAPPQIQSRLYQQAAQRAIDEGNTDRALQIANDHLEEQSRNLIMQAVDFKKLTTSPSPEKLNEIKMKLATLPSDSDRIKYLTTLADASRKDNPKLALRFLDDARALISRRAMTYRDFEDQIRVADAYAALDSKRSLEIVETGISQLNELLTAATVLNGFEVNIFKEGELYLRADSDLVGMVARFGQELATLAKFDFDGARLSADRFQLPEPRMHARLSIVQSILGKGSPMNFNRRPQNFQFFQR
jgi:ribosomal protein L20